MRASGGVCEKNAVKLWLPQSCWDHRSADGGAGVGGGGASCRELPQLTIYRPLPITCCSGLD